MYIFFDDHFKFDVDHREKVEWNLKRIQVI